MQKKTKTIIVTVAVIIIIAILFILLMQRKTNKVSQIDGHFAKATVYTRIGKQEFDITNLIEQNPTPKISAGMIPVKQNGEYWEITTIDDNTWYDYGSSKPAYMMLNDGVYQSEEYYQMPKSKKLAEDNIGTQISIDDTETLGSIYMWVPRFAYSDDENVEEKIIYVKQESAVAGNYIMPDIFTYTIGDTEVSLSGIWVEVNSLASEGAVTTKVIDLNKGEQDTIYGFLVHTKATAMTEDEQLGIKKYTENVLQSVYEDNFTNKNHTILKILNHEKVEPILATAISNSATGIATITVTYTKNGINKILDEDGNELQNEIVDNKIIATSLPQNNGIRKFYIIDNIGNAKAISVEVTGTLIIASSVFNGNDLEITINVQSSRFNIAKIVYTKKNNDVKNIVLSENSTTAILDKATNGIYEFEVIDIKGNSVTVTREVSGISVYIIETYDDLKDFRDDVNNGLTNYTTKAYQVADVVVPESNWVPIGNYLNSGTSATKLKSFGGTYDGQGYSITLNTINNVSDSNGYYGLFGYVYGKDKNNYATIKNLKVKGSIKGGKSVGGITGQAQYANINNCSNECKIKVENVGSSYSGKVGGIVGSSSYLNINNCCNLGEISASGTASSYNVGGVIGSSSNTAEIKNCYNAGKVSSSGGSNSTSCCGGIVGYFSNNIKNCYNIGEISGSTITGGICGSTAKNVSYCYNYGNVTCTNEYAVGICARATLITHCFNNGNITSSKGEAYGVSQSLTSGPTISFCYNTGTIYAKDRVGGIGYRGTINNCYNIGNVTSSNDEAGGIASYGDKIEYCFNTGSITGYNRAGGIAVGSTSTVVKYCYNKGNIKSTYASSNYTGGILGYGSSEVNYCYNVGRINGHRSGGIGGYGSSFKYCYSIGDVTGSNRAGGMCAYSGSAQSCYYLSSTVTAPQESYKNKIGTEVSRADLISNVSAFANFKADIGINDGYPILSWQTENDEYIYDKLDLINSDNVFVADTNNINNGYPILAWQAE